MIDFSSAENAPAVLERCVETGQALVIGTTGLDEGFQSKLASAAGKIAVVAAPNMSVGMNVLFNTVGRIARLLGPDYDIEIVEVHHGNNTKFKVGPMNFRAWVEGQNVGIE